MGLKQSIVIVNEFTTKTAKGGTRGGTPGDYVTRYMSRNGATEDLTPVRLNTENYITRYMAREQAVDEAVSVDDLKSRMRNIQGMGGVAFGYGEVSLSDANLKKAAKDIQKQFNNGKTVMKTVLSFDENYLREHGIINPDFEFSKEGDYRGHIDQMKLRMAIMNGMDKLGRHYDDLQYVGVIQVDTKHVHCHLAMVDRGTGNLMPDGKQRGKLTEKEKGTLRRGINTFLDEKQTVKMMTANVEQDRHNTVCFVKKFTHKAVQKPGFAQFLISCLPEDKNLWRASSHRKEMQKPNAIVREYVKQLLEQPDSGYKEALQRVEEYAQRRTRDESLTGKQYRELYKRGQNRIIEQSMNSVYSVLKQIPDSERIVRTPMLDMMSMPYEDMANSADTSPMAEFGFKLRSYKSRLDYHKKEMNKYHQAVSDYEKQEADETSLPLYEYLKIEEEYNAMLLAKYQHFLDFRLDDDEYKDSYDEMMSADKRIENLVRMKSDTTILHMSEQNAESYCERIYEETGGHYIISKPEIIDRRIKNLRTEFEQRKKDLSVMLQGYGLGFDDHNNIVRQTKYDFDDVKALDLHHLMYDFSHDFAISNDNVNKFVEMADKRRKAFEKAEQYLRATGQEDTISNFPKQDIELQSETAEKFRNGEMFKPMRSGEKTRHVAAKTVSLDYALYDEREEEIKNVIKNTIEELQYE